MRRRQGRRASELRCAFLRGCYTVELIDEAAPADQRRSRAVDWHDDLSLAIALGTLRSNNEINFAVEHLKQRQHLIDGLAVVGLVEEPIQLRGGGPEPADDLALR